MGYINLRCSEPGKADALRQQLAASLAEAKAVRGYINRCSEPCKADALRQQLAAYLVEAEAMQAW